MARGRVEDVSGSGVNGGMENKESWRRVAERRRDVIINGTECQSVVTPTGLTGNDMSARTTTCVRVVRSHRVTGNIQSPYNTVCVAERKSCRIGVGVPGSGVGGNASSSSSSRNGNRRSPSWMSHRRKEGSESERRLSSHASRRGNNTAGTVVRKSRERRARAGTGARGWKGKMPSSIFTVRGGVWGSDFGRREGGRIRT
ncbi:hypothetical protein ARMGADRAFT_1040111 [Armillaria gallica]|uniref:Uncharacterized protein n=1 Tax=Armillaria gallica TaxID=47427 RepID=A0A2H3CPP5_ARMGA|nr:hypothetical protein ARMGADRAFT_1040111 [Armillaria gallica]